MGYVSDNIELLSDIAKAISMEFGSNCEVVLHDLTLPYNKTIVGIWNGHVTGRKIGDGGTNAGLAILKGTSSPSDQCYINTLPNGHILRTTSKYFRDEYGKVNGSLCINFDITNLVKASATIQSITGNIFNQPTNNEFYSNNLDDLLNSMMKQAVKELKMDENNLSKSDKQEIVYNLNQKGFFQIKKSVSILAKFLGLSRYSIYNYINLSKQES